MLNEFPQIDEQLKVSLKPGRYIHTLGVAYTAAALAMRYGTDVRQAFLAGLLHDCAKDIPDKEAVEICRKNGVSLTDYEIDHPHLLHAKLGAFWAQKRYSVTDADILSAIRWHTTGTTHMSVLEQIIFLADYIEPGRREFDGLREARSLAFQDLDRATELVLRQTIGYLKPKYGEAIDENTKTAYAYYKQFFVSGQTD